MTIVDSRADVVVRSEPVVGTLVFDSVAQQWVIDALPHVIMRVKRILPRAHQTRSGAVRVADNPGVVRDLTWIVDRWPLTVTAADQAHLDAQLERFHDTQGWTAAIMAGHAQLPATHRLARTPRDYQVQAADLCRATGRLLVVDDLGLGKSMTGLLVLQAQDALPALIVTLAGLMPEQFASELSKTFPQLRGHVLCKASPYDFDDKLGYTPDVLICNYHKLSGWADVLAGQVRTVIFDEIHELRRTDSDKYRAAGRIADSATYRMGLTATPIFNYGDEIHAVINIVAPGELGTKSEFQREWCIPTGNLTNAHAVKDPQALGTHLREEGIMLRRTRKQVGRELPDLMTITHIIESDTNIITQANSSAADLAHLILDSSAPSQQRFLARGEFEARMRQATGIAKAAYVAAFVDLLLDTEDNVVLFGWHHAVYSIWEHALSKHKPALYTGEQSLNQKRAAKEAFINGDSRVLMLSLRSGAGLDGLQEHCHVAVFGELDWSPSIHKQGLGRLHRDGQTEPVLGYYLLSNTGADPIMADTLQLKRHQSQPVIDPTGDDPIAATRTPDDHIRRLAQSLLDTHPARPLTRQNPPTDTAAVTAAVTRPA